MPTDVIKNAFAAGELSNAVIARTDLAKYAMGAALLDNFWVDYRGGAVSRAGSEYVGLAYGPVGQAIRIIKFQFSTEQNYVLELGHHYMRVIMDGALITEGAKAITAATKASPVVLTVPGHGYAVGDWIRVNGVGGMTQLNGRTFQVSTIAGNQFNLFDQDGNAVNGTAFGAYTSGGTTARVFKLTTPWEAADLALLKFAQSADVMTFTHRSYPPYDLTRTAHDAWTLTLVSFASSIAAPTGLVVTTTTTGTTTSTPITQYFYTVTATSQVTGDESLPANGVAVAGHSFDTVKMYNTIKWNAVTDAGLYSVYRAPWVEDNATVPANPTYGLIGTTRGLEFKDDNITADFSVGYPTHRNPFVGPEYPGCNSYFQQRHGYANSYVHPMTLWFSQSGSLKNMDVSIPVKDSDAITLTIAALEVNAVNAMVPMPGGLVLMTTGSVWQLSGNGQGSAISPTEINAQPQSYSGANDMPPIVNNMDIMYVNSMGNVVRNLNYNFLANIYSGTDITVLSRHLFDSFELLEWCHMEEPNKQIWMNRSDGRILVVTYLKDQDIQAWSQIATDGTYMSMCSIIEGNENVCYTVVQRPIGARYRNYIERFKSRLTPYGADGAWCLDSALTLPKATPFGVLFPTAGKGTADHVFTTPGAFVAGHVGQVIRVRGGIGTVTQFVSASEVIVNWRKPIVQLMQNEVPVASAPGVWTIAPLTSTIGGLHHLEGMTNVYAIVDGAVQGPFAVVAGSITLGVPGSSVIAGLKFRCRLQTLRVETPGGGTIQGDFKQIGGVTLRVKETRGIQYGKNFEQLDFWRADQDLGVPLLHQTYTGDWFVITEPRTDTEGQICIQQDQPLPCTILGLIPQVEVTGR